MREVDFFLDEIIERFEKLEAERKEMLSAMEYLLKRVEALGCGKNGDGRTLAAAESTFKRLRAAAPTGPVRVQPGTAPKKEQRPVKKRVRPATELAPEPEAELEAEAAPVAIEMETEAYAPDLTELMPELLTDMEAVMDAGLSRGSVEPEEDEGEERA